MLQTYQTLVVGSLGFLGVVFTMLANAYLQRKQHEIKILHEANALRVALKTELNANRKTFEERVEQFHEPSEFSDALIQNKSIDKIYNVLLGNIGLLTEQEIEKVTEAYALLAEIPYRIRIITGTNAVGGFNDEFIRIKNSHYEVISKMHEITIPIISQAIDAIAKHLNSTE